MRIGVDVGGTNTDAVLMDGDAVLAFTKQPTTDDVSGGVSAAVRAVLDDAQVAPGEVGAVMIGTTHFTNALVERAGLDRVGIIRLASPSGEALPPMTGWPAELIEQIGREIHLLPGGYEVDGRDIAPFDEAKVRSAARTLKAAGIHAVAISCAFAPINPDMEQRAARIVLEEHPDAAVSLSGDVGKLGLIERENGTILNAALTTLAAKAVHSFEKALRDAGLDAPLYISQNDGTLISSDYAARYPVLTIGSGPTNSMRGAAFLTGLRNAIVMDVGGTTCDIGVLANGFPRESSIAVDIGGIRTNFRMPDVLALGIGGGTRIHLDGADLRVGPDSVGYRIDREAYLFGGETLTASDVAVALGQAKFGNADRLPDLGPDMLDAIWARIQATIEDGLDRMKTARGDITIVAVGGGHFLVSDTLKGAARVVRPPHAAVANAVGAAIAQIGAQIERMADYDATPRAEVMAQAQDEARRHVEDAGGARDSIEIVDVEEIFLSYLPGKAVQLRIKAVGDLAPAPQSPVAGLDKKAVRHAG